MNNKEEMPDVVYMDDLKFGNHLEEELTLEQRKDRVYNLSIELADAQNERKSIMKAHTENIHRIRDEIKELIADELNTHNV